MANTGNKQTFTHSCTASTSTTFTTATTTTTHSSDNQNININVGNNGTVSHDQPNHSNLKDRRESVRFNFTLLNIQGLISRRSNKLRSKELTQIFQQNDFILLTETWTNDLCDISVDGFTVFQLNRTCKKRNAKRDSGGIALYVKSSLERQCILIKKEKMILFG